MSTDLGSTTFQEPTTRADLARLLLARLDRFGPRQGDTSLAAEIQLLKRTLARGHAVLAIRREDNNYRSVITLVEAALASLTWKDYSPPILDALRRAFTAGLREGPFPFEEYRALRRHFKELGLRLGPTIDLNSTEIEEEDGSQA